MITTEQDNKAAAEKVEQTEQNIGPQKTVDISPGEKLRDECGGCRLSFNWFRRATRVSSEDKRHMADSVESTESGFSASKRLMDSRHPSVKRANELRNRIYSAWMGMTLPLAAANVEGNAKLESGTRLIRKEDAEEFNSRMMAFRSEADAVTKEVNDNLEDIKAMDQDRLGKLYNDQDYPENIELAFSWGFPNIEVPSYLEELAPEVYAQERQAVTERFEHTFELATTSMIREFQAVLEGWVDRLGPVVRIYPPNESEYSHLREAEVVTKIEHRDAPERVPNEDDVLLEVKPKGKKATETEWLGPMSKNTFASLQPTEAINERKTFRDSTIEGLSDMLAKFRRLGDTLTPSDEMQEIIRQMEDHLAQFGSVDEMTSELRNSRTVRKQTHALAEKLNEKLTNEIATVHRKKRRVTRLS